MNQQPSLLDTVFCPHCHTLLLGQQFCPNNDWQRPQGNENLGSPVWERDLDGEIGKPYFTLAAAGELLYCGIEKGERPDQLYSELIALETATGQIRWRTAFPANRFARFLTLTEELLISSSEHLGVLAGAQSLVQALDPSTGSVIWKTELPAHSFSAPAAAGDLLFISASDHHVYALDRQDGRIAWQSAPLPNWSPAPPTLSEDALFIGGFTHIISRLTLDGLETTLYNNQYETDWFDMPPAYGLGMLYAPTSSRQLLAINAREGTLNWSQAIDRGASAPPLFAGDQLFLPLKGQPSGRYLLRAINPHDGQTTWEFETDKHILAPPIYDDGELYVGSRGGKFYALQAGDGQMLWEFDAGQAVRTTAVVNGPYLLFGTADGRMHCLLRRAPTREPLKSPDSYRLEDEWLLAGTAAARKEQWLDAAHDFERGAQPFVAAQLFERAGAWERAAPLYAQVNQYQHAFNAYQQLGDQRHMAEMLLQLKQPETAAGLFANLGDHARAAAIYHEGGYLRRAAAEYAQAGEFDQAIKLYLALKQPESAALLAEEAGEIDHAVAIWVDIGSYERAANLLAANKRRPEAAALLEDHKLIHAAAGLWAEVGDYKKAALIFDRANLWSDAAQNYEKAKLPVKAAQAYFLAGEARQAADLYMSGGKTQKALTIYLQLQAYNSIAKIYEQQKQWPEAAQAYLAATPPRYEKAAACFTKTGAWSQAAQAYQDAGLIEQAVANWRKSETPRQAAELLREQGRLAETAALLVELGSLQDAAELELEIGHIKEAVTLYRQLGNDERAAQVAHQYERWDLIGEMARESGDYEQEAEAARALARQYPGEDYLHYRAAARAYVRAAQQHEAREQPLMSNEAIARLWELAADYFDQGMVDDKQLILQSRREVRRLRHWPEIVVEVQAERILAIDRWDGLIVHVKNIGYGVARHVTTKVIPGEFEGKLDTQMFSGILPERTERIRLNVRPRSAGSSVPLYIRISYMRDNQETIERDIGTEVPVHDHDSKYATSEAQIGQRKPINLHRDEEYEDDGRRSHTIIVQGDYITVGEIKDGTVAIGKSAAAAGTHIISNQLPDNPAQDLSAPLSALAEKMDSNLTLDEINALARFLNIDLSDLPGTVKIEKAYALAEQLQQAGNLEPLFALLEAKYPDAEVDWRTGF